MNLTTQGHHEFDSSHLSPRVTGCLKAEFPKLPTEEWEPGFALSDVPLVALAQVQLSVGCSL